MDGEAAYNIPQDYLDYVPEKYKSWSSRESIPVSSNRLPEAPWNEAEYLQKIELVRVGPLNDSEVKQQWSKVKTALDDGTFSEETLRELLELGLNLRGKRSTEKPLLSDKVPRTPFQYVSVLSKQPYSSGVSTASNTLVQLTLQAQETGQSSTMSQETTDSEARAICFICCFYMRLANKPPEHVEKALGPLKVSYSSLYGTGSTLLSKFNPNVSWAYTIHNGLRSSRLTSSTLGYRLACAEEVLKRTDDNYGICRMLLFQHLEMIGMQIYKMAINLMADMKMMSPGELLGWIEVPDSVETVENILKIATITDNPTRTPMTYHWKYSKLYNPAYFVNMNPSKNRFLAQVLAKLTNIRGLARTDDYADPTNMKAISGMDQNEKNKANHCARVIAEAYALKQTKSGKGVGLAYSIIHNITIERPQKRQRVDGDGSNPIPVPPPVQPQGSAPPPPDNNDDQMIDTEGFDAALL
ncbi:nucleocapsid protein [Peach virus 1]|uniref:Nucleoprotein n=1 Tax=Peach virus 1 TaxID=2721273 RepID=A0A6G9L5Z9_9RHAB|nr:nucleocapsid protein [Peach virus 1]QIQ60845.1 nucleocapsid protein [Peach virus 1]